MVGLLRLAKLLTIFGMKLKKWDTAGTLLLKSLSMSCHFYIRRRGERSKQP